MKKYNSSDFKLKPIRFKIPLKNKFNYNSNFLKSNMSIYVCTDSTLPKDCFRIVRTHLISHEQLLSKPLVIKQNLNLLLWYSTPNRSTDYERISTRFGKYMIIPHSISSYCNELFHYSNLRDWFILNCSFQKLENRLDEYFNQNGQIPDISNFYYTEPKSASFSPTNIIKSKISKLTNIFNMPKTKKESNLFVYILKLEQGKFYIGKTVEPHFRINNHFESNGSAWTTRYRPIELLELIPDCDDYDEDKYTKMYMDKFGIDNVRGGSFVSVELSDSTRKFLEQMCRGTNNKCFKCGKAHFVKNCPTFQNGLVNINESDSDDSDVDTDDNSYIDTEDSNDDYCN